MKTKKLTFGAMCLAISLLLPQVFHIIGMQQAGSVFLPMHLPVFIGGMLLGPIYGLFLGIFAPLTSFVVTGMPSAAYFDADFKIGYTGGGTYGML